MKWRWMPLLTKVLQECRCGIGYPGPTADTWARAQVLAEAPTVGQQITSLEGGDVEEEKPTRRRAVIWVAVLALLAFVAYTRLTIFVVQPIGAVPEGRTVIMRRTGNLQFIDSADAVCERETGSVNLLCRAAILGSVANSDKILARLPYSEALYSMSTNGKHYER